MKLGQTLGGLLNATSVNSAGRRRRMLTWTRFGNAVELIVAIAALAQGETINPSGADSQMSCAWFRRHCWARSCLICSWCWA